jgi:hypothetical protein
MTAMRSRAIGPPDAELGRHARVLRQKLASLTAVGPSGVWNDPIVPSALGRPVGDQAVDEDEPDGEAEQKPRGPAHDGRGGGAEHCHDRDDDERVPRAGQGSETQINSCGCTRRSTVAECL